MKRRSIVKALGATAVAIADSARAQRAVPAVGVLLNDAPETFMPQLVEALRRLGYEPDGNVRHEVRSAHGNAALLPALAVAVLANPTDIFTPIYLRLVGYAANQVELFEQTATYVDKITRGTDPASLPVTQPSRFDLNINLRTATAIGVVVPPAILAIASRLRHLLRERLTQDDRMDTESVPHKPIALQRVQNQMPGQRFRTNSVRKTRPLIASW